MAIGPGGADIPIIVDPPLIADLPLIVDLDGTLVRTDLFVETGFAWIGAQPRRIFEALFLAARGKKAALKAEIAKQTPLDVSLLPYNSTVLGLIEQARGQGRRIYIASGSNERYVAAVARHIGADGWFASNDCVNLTGAAKAQKLVAVFGEKAFDYIGNDWPDLAVWAVSRRGVAIEPPDSLRRRLVASHSDVRIVDATPGRWRAWLKLLRPHQWAKNILVFVPMLTAHSLNFESAMASLAAFVSFSLAASSVYVVNDLVDVEDDRKHPSKRRRPLASGAVPIARAPALAGGLVIVALAVALSISWPFVAVLLGYLALTTAYSFSLKRKLLVDIVTLAALYTIRVIAGATAIMVPVSEWLLGFSMFIFASLALIKRYVELTTRIDGDLPDAANRNYRKSDRSVIGALAAASGFNAITVFALYVSSDNVRLLYQHPRLLWLACPILMYWIGRMLILAERRQLHDDPVLFAIRDRVSWLSFGLIGVILALAAV